jgi:hypothetical protein
MNPKSYIITLTPRSNNNSAKHRLDLDISIAKDIRIQIHGMTLLQINLIARYNSKAVKLSNVHFIIE